MTRDDPDAEALRRRLYRPDASPTDVADYLSAAEAEPDAASSAPEPAEPRRSARPTPFVIGGVVVAAAALLGAVLLTSGPPTPTAAATTPAAPTVRTTQDSDGSWTVTSGESVVLDGGERDHAHGSSVAEGPDRLRYTVSSDDTVAAIARRFQLCPADVLQALPYGFDAGSLPAGTTLELTRLGTTTC